MNSIPTIYIPFVENNIDARFIQQVFYYNNIATIKDILFLPSYNENFKQAILEIYYWHNSNYVYDIILRLKNSILKTVIYYDEGKYFWIKSYSLNNTYLQFTDNNNNILPLSIRSNKNRINLSQKIQDNLDWRDIEISLYNNNLYHNLLFTIRN